MDAEGPPAGGVGETAVLLERAGADAADREHDPLLRLLGPAAGPVRQGERGVRFCRQARRPAAKARRGAGASAGKHRRLFLRFAGQAGAGPGAVPGAQAGRGELLWALPPHDVPHRAAGLAGAGGVREGDRPQRGLLRRCQTMHYGLVGLQAASSWRRRSCFGQRAEAWPRWQRLCWTLCRTISGCSLWSSIPLWPLLEGGGLGRLRAAPGLSGPHPARRPGLCRPAGPARPRAGAAPDRPRPGAGRLVAGRCTSKRSLPPSTSPKAR